MLRRQDEGGGVCGKTGIGVLTGVDGAVVYMVAVGRGTVLSMAHCISWRQPTALGVFGVGHEGPAMIRAASGLGGGSLGFLIVRGTKVCSPLERVLILNLGGGVVTGVGRGGGALNVVKAVLRPLVLRK